MRAQTVRRIIVAAVALHSIALGAAMLFFPTGTLNAFGWPYEGSTFFPSQSGIFLLLLGVSYVGGVYHLQFAFFLVGSKACAVVFLLVQHYANEAQGLLLEAAAGDAIMCLAVAAALLMEYRSRRRSTCPAA